MRLSSIQIIKKKMLIFHRILSNNSDNDSQRGTFKLTIENIFKEITKTEKWKKCMEKAQDMSGCSHKKETLKNSCQKTG